MCSFCSQNCQRIIRLKSLNSKTDPAVLAKEVVEKCDIIHKSQISEVEQIIYYLKNRKDIVAATGKIFETYFEMYGWSTVEFLDILDITQNTMSRNSGKVSPIEQKEKASIRNLEEYVELLYEDLPDRIRGSALILRLARFPDNLEELEKNGNDLLK